MLYQRKMALQEFGQLNGDAPSKPFQGPARSGALGSLPRLAAPVAPELEREGADDYETLFPVCALKSAPRTSAASHASDFGVLTTIPATRRFWLGNAILNLLSLSVVLRDKNPGCECATTLACGRESGGVRNVGSTA